jgi:hypothetical protein
MRVFPDYELERACGLVAELDGLSIEQATDALHRAIDVLARMQTVPSYNRILIKPRGVDPKCWRLNGGPDHKPE